MTAATKRLKDERRATAAIAQLHVGVEVALEKAERSHKKKKARLAEELRSAAELDTKLSAELQDSQENIARRTEEHDATTRMVMKEHDAATKKAAEEHETAMSEMTE